MQSTGVRNMKQFLQAIRAPFLTATLVPVLVGTAEAARTGFFDPLLFVVVLCGAACFHISANVLNDYFDYRGGTDNINKYHNPFSGGSRLIQEGIYTPKKTLSVGLLFLLFGVGIGIYLVFLTGPALLIFGVVGAFLVLTYSIDRFGLSYIGGGLGELAVAVAFGPLMVLGTYYVMAKALSLPAFLLSLPVALLIALVLLVNGYPDYEADAATDKHTIVVSYGRGMTRFIYALLLGAVYVIVVIGVVVKTLPIPVLVALATLPLAFIAVKTLFKVYRDPRAVVAVCGMTVMNHMITGVLLTIGIVASIFI
jgi:1,4-dihydroxy-2-naphthoate octaprenyltransferase